MKLKKWLLLILLLLLLSGCNQPEEVKQEKSSDTTWYREGDLFETKETLANEMATKENLQEIWVNPKEPEMAENIDYVKYDAANCFRSPDLEKNMRSLFCIDEATGVIYFVNQNKDWYIYRLLNGKAELAVNLPARELHILNGTLYFVVEGYDEYEWEESIEGDIYAYTPADGRVEKVFSSENLETKIEHIKPFEDGIAFYYNVYQEPDADGVVYVESEYYYYTFADGILEKDPYRRVLPGTKDYYMMPAISNGVWKTFFWSRTNHQKESIDLNIEAAHSFIMENTMYSRSGYKYYLTDILTGEQQMFDCDAILKEWVPELAEYLADKKVVLNGFTVTKDYLWAIVFREYLLRINPINGEAVCYRINANIYEIDDLYTDGVDLYATYGQGELIWDEEWKGGVLVRICTEKTVGQHIGLQVPLLAVEYVTE